MDNLLAFLLHKENERTVLAHEVSFFLFSENAFFSLYDDCLFYNHDAIKDIHENLFSLNILKV